LIKIHNNKIYLKIVPINLTMEIEKFGGTFFMIK